MTMILSINGHPDQTVASFAAASAAYSQVRDLSGEGVSTFPTGRLHSPNAAYRVSYNGKVWLGDEHASDLIFDPSA